MKIKACLLALPILAVLASRGNGDSPKKEQADKAFFPVNAQVLHTRLKIFQCPAARSIECRDIDLESRFHTGSLAEEKFVVEHFPRDLSVQVAFLTAAYR